jgi:hypothetical protein
MILEYGVYYIKYLEDGWIKERGSFSRDPFNEMELESLNEYIRDGVIEVIKIESLKDQEVKDES